MTDGKIINKIILKIPQIKKPFPSIIIETTHMTCTFGGKNLCKTEY